MVRHLSRSCKQYTLILGCLVVITLLSVVPFVQAQSGTLTVSGASGTIKLGDVCPTPRDAAVYLTVGAAAACSQADDTVEVQRGTYAESLKIDHNLTIIGTGSNEVVLTGGTANRVVYITAGATVDLRDLTITGGYAAQGGAIYLEVSNLQLTRVVIQDNAADMAGAGIYTVGSNLQIIDTQFNRNTISTFTNSDATTISGGAGLYVASGRVDIANTQFSQNTVSVSNCLGEAQALGGAIYIADGDVTISNVQSAENAVNVSNCGGGSQVTTAGADLFAAAGNVTISPESLTDAMTLLGMFPTPTLMLVAPETTAEVALPTLVNLASATPMSTLLPAVVSSPAPSTATPTDALVAVRWMTVVLEAIRVERLTPPVASRVLGYAGVTLYEAVIPSAPDYVSLSGQLNQMPSMPSIDPKAVYDWQISANSALAALTADLFASASPVTLERFQTLQAQIEQERGEVVPVNVFKRSQDFGTSIAQAINAWAATDNYTATRNLTYALPTGNPAFWIPLENQKPLEPYWGTLRPFAMPLTAACEVPTAIPFSTDSNSAFYRQAEEVRQTVTNLTDEQRAIAQFWADNPGETATPPGHWVSIENQLVIQMSLGLPQAAEMYALTGIALRDAFISCWQSKYRYQLVRPITYIQTFMDASWQPILTTPPFPEYPSGHSVASGAAATVLTALFGDMAFTDNTHANRMLPARSYTSFAQAADEAAMSRLYGGIHYREAIENGVVQGRCIGQTVSQLHTH